MGTMVGVGALFANYRKFSPFQTHVPYLAARLVFFANCEEKIHTFPGGRGKPNNEEFAIIYHIIRNVQNDTKFAYSLCKVDKANNDFWSYVSY